MKPSGREISRKKCNPLALREEIARPSWPDSAAEKSRDCSNRTSTDPRWVGYVFWVGALLLTSFPAPCPADELPGAVHFRERVQPILEKYCYNCHGNGESEGNRTLDAFASDEALLKDTGLWWAVMKNVRTGIMPPPGEEKPSAEERKILLDWIIADSFAIDPADPDPGRVTLRRLNRVEYRNTIRDLMGVRFDTNEEFPADDSGYGFDNIGDVLSLTPLLVEKYLQAAEKIVDMSMESDPHRFFPDGPAPEDSEQRDAYARKVLTQFVRHAYRRPAADATIDRLVAIAKQEYTQPDHTFEAGVGRAMTAVLASPRFLFRTEEPAAASADARFPQIDEYALASRLSYFLWSTMPDEPLLSLADQGKLRENLPAQVARMLKSKHSDAFVKNFAGQWLRARDVENAKIYALPALGLQADYEAVVGELRELKKQRAADAEPEQAQPSPEEGSGEIDEEKAREAARAEKLRAERERLDVLREMFTDELRHAMRRETEMYFEHVLREDRSVLELIDSNYTFLNEILAKHYGIPGVAGEEMRRVELPPDSPRGGLLTQGTLLVVTSNPNRTSPVKRGLHILDNVIGFPPPPPPPAAVPALEDAVAASTGHRPTIRELQELHQREPLCQACHARMDPIGLALENFNAMGMWRDTEHGQAIDTSGKLITGESFDGIRQLKSILKEQHRLDVYRCFTEKMLIYALGRGLEYYDEHTVDLIVQQLDQHEGKMSVLLMGIIQSAAFDKQRRPETVAAQQP